MSLDCPNEPKTSKAKKRFPCTIYGIVVMLLILVVGGLMKPAYDSFPGVLYFILSPVFGFMFYIPHEVMSSLNDGTVFAGQEIIAGCIGLVFCLVADMTRYSYRRFRKGA
jgi:hypothetical protein